MISAPLGVLSSFDYVVQCMLAEIDSAGLQAFQSSTAFIGVASRAIDGNTDPVYGGGSCTHTDRDVHPWWALDLGVSTQLARVEITNRQLNGEGLQC